MGSHIMKSNLHLLFTLILSVMVASCTSGNRNMVVHPGDTGGSNFDYTLAPGDRINIFVWRNPEVSTTDIPVRPDGRISSPLVEDLMASGKTPTQLANNIEEILSKYIKDPFVTVTVVDFVGGFQQQIRVVGEAATPQALPYRANMTLLDVMITVGGLTEFAAGNKAKIVRNEDGRQSELNVRINDLLKGGDISANVPVHPGDIIVIPESFF